MPLISKTPAWRNLQTLRDHIDVHPLSALFDADGGRSAEFSLDLGDLYLDYARQRLTPDVRAGLLALAEQADVRGFLQNMMAGAELNNTEGRAVLHTACRGTQAVDPAINDAVAAADASLKTFVDGVHDGSIKTLSGGRFTSVVAIGIGGSELGPALVIDALKDQGSLMDVRICGNIDGIAFARAFAGLDPAETLVIVVSKSYTTQETAANAQRAKALMQAAVGDGWADHFAVVSANLEATGSFGVADERVFPMWDWVGGRYSLWSAVGLPIALAFGWDAFSQLRNGARDMDAHALNARLSENMPVLMGLFTVWNASFLGYGAEACVPYDTRLALLVSHLQQLEMESNGKRVTRDGEAVDYATQPAVFGGVGTNVQHAFFQQLHQGVISAPVDILLPATPPTGDAKLYKMLASNALAQADALAFGQANTDDPHRHYPGNRPSSILMYDDLTPYMLGKLIALYEHKTAVAGAVWGVNSFDQWGVELGKKLSGGIEKMLSGEAPASASLAPILAAASRMKAPQ